MKPVSSEGIHIRIATRQSRLALWQAHHVKALLLQLQGVADVTLVPMSTKGDEILDRSLSKIGGKGLFIKELEHALLEARADLAVHSGKDIPMDLDPQFELLGFMEREDPRDAWLSPHYKSLNDLPDGAKVGTSSLRRQAMLLHTHPKLQVLPLRGNLDTRLAKLQAGTFDGIVLATAGLVRLGLGSHIQAHLPLDVFVPAPAQGALGLQVLQGGGALGQPLLDACCALLCRKTSLEVAAERAVSRQLGGSCQVPLGVYATLNVQSIMHLSAVLSDPAGKCALRAKAQHTVHSESDLSKLVLDVVQQLKSQGADQVLGHGQANTPSASSPFA